MENQYFTFGVKYRREEHPVLGKIDPDEVIEVRGATYDQARAIVNALLDKAWAFQYSGVSPDFVTGVFMTIEVKDHREES